MTNIQVGTFPVVSEHGPLNLLGCSIMSHRIDPYPMKKDPLGDYSNGMYSTEGKIQIESERHNMGGNSEIQNMISSIIQGFRNMTHNTILSRKETR